MYFLGGLYSKTTPFFGTNLTPNVLLRSLGVEVTDSIELATRYISLDVNAVELEKIEKIGIPLSERILLRFEPRVVWPKNYDASLLSKFGRIFDVGRSPAPEIESEFWPQFWDQPIDIASGSQSRLDRIVLINSNKVSCNKGELYSLRKKAVNRIESADLFGVGWDDPIARNFVNWLKAMNFTLSHRHIPVLTTAFTFFRFPKNYHGQLEDKISKLKEYKYSLVIENSTEVVTEKVFDSFVAGTFPIYVGPDLTKLGVPPNLFISAEPNLPSIENSILEARKINLEAWRIDLQEWMNREETQMNWNYHFVFTRLISKTNAI
jgi:hypothetical protein